MWTAVLGSFQSSLVLGSLDSVLPRFVNQMYGWNSIQAGAAFLAFVGPCIFSPTVGQLTHRYGARKCAIWGYTGAGVSLGLIGAAAGKQPPFQALLLVMLCISGVFILFAEISSWVDAVTAAEIQALERPHRFRQGFLAHVYGLTNIMFASGFVLGPIGAGFLYQRFGWITVALLLGIGTIACSLPTIIWMQRVTISQEPRKVVYQEPEIA
ncbi:MFS general substrate transporter [Aspergillus pseudoustus]|uniref:MFS general substrate transporter n=1 Tax=Aspergillus pseudoustus TaxID=1810923 RepID=A0ABR4K4K1_9EURO